MGQASFHRDNEIFSPDSSYEKIKRLVDFENGRKLKILDVGSGSGVLDEDLRKMGHEVTELDIHPRQHLPPHFVQCDIEGVWPVGDGIYDLVICTDVPEHVYDPAHILDEARRVLAPDGFCIFGVPNHFDLRQRFRMFFGEGIVHWDQKERFAEQAWKYSHIRFFTLPDLLLLFKQQGWQVCRAQFNYMGAGVIPGRLLPGFVKTGLLKLWPNLFSGKFIYLLQGGTGQVRKPQTVYIPYTLRGI